MSGQLLSMREAMPRLGATQKIGAGSVVSGRNHGPSIR